MEKKYGLIFFLFVSFFLISCSDEKSKKKEPVKTENIKHVNAETDKELFLKNFQLSIPIKKIQVLSVSNFMQMYLSRMEHEIYWVLKLQKYAKGQEINESETENKKGKKFMAQKKKMEELFFQKWGVAKKSFERFAQSHEKEIQKYMGTHNEIQSFIERIQKLNAKLYQTQNEEDFGDEELPENQ